MSYSMGRRKSSVKNLSVFKEPPGPILKFQWSISAAKLALSDDDDEAIIFPSIDTNRSERKFFAGSPSLIDQKSVSNSSLSSHKNSYLPNISKKCHSPTLTKPKKKSSRRNPLSLSYSQLYQVSPPSLAKHSTRANLSIYPIPDDQHDNISLVNSKVSFPSSPSISSSPTMSLLSSTIPENQSSKDNLIRLQTPQLRRLNVSDKYLNEVKKLYFNVNCKSFVPRMSLAQIF